MVHKQQDLADAIALYEQGGQSLRKLSLEFGIPRATLFDRIAGAGRDAPGRAHTLQSGEQGGKGMLAPWLVAPLAGLGA